MESDQARNVRILFKANKRMSSNHVLNFFFQNLDALHDHLATIYPGMRAPSFRCTDAEKGKGLILHYYSEREGLQDIVIGIIKTVAQQIHGTEIDMKVMPEELFTFKCLCHQNKVKKSEVMANNHCNCCCPL